MGERILFCTGEGIGNVVQCVPVIRTLQKRLGYDIDFWHAFGNYPIPKIIPYVDKWYAGEELYKQNLSRYSGLVTTAWTVKYAKQLTVKIPQLVPHSRITMDRSEVDTYMDIARSLNVLENNLVWHGRLLYEPIEEGFDVVIHDGFNKFGSANWRIKSYPYYTNVVQILKDKYGIKKIASVGQPKEYIKGTVNKTGVKLTQTIGLLKNAKVFLGNDSGLYHCANAVETNNIVLFTATSTVKNYDKRFHKYAKILGREDLKCRPCQHQRRWNKDCKTWSCRELNPELVAKEVYNLL
jgi:ADP-heptose:LPS heptosyltransferase